MSNWTVIRVLGICTFILGCSQQFVFGLPQQIADSVGVGLADISIMQTVFGLCNGAGAPIAIVLTVNKGYKKQLLIGLGFLAAGMLMMGLGQVFWVLVLARGIMGLGMGLFVSIAYAAAILLAEKGAEAKASATVAIGFTAALVLALPIARLTVGVIDWHYVYLILCVLTVATIIFLGARLAPMMPEKERDSLRERLAPFKNPLLTGVMVTTFLVQAGGGAYFLYLTPLIEIMLADYLGLVSAALLAIGIASVISTKACGKLIGTFGPVKILWLSLIAQAVLFFVMVFVLRYPWCVGVSFLISLAMWVYVPAQNTLIARIDDGEVGRLAVSLSNSCLQLGIAAGSAMAGAVINNFSVEAIPVDSCVVVVFTIVFFALVCRAIRRRKPESLEK